jgi:hypothetical protein
MLLCRGSWLRGGLTLTRIASLLTRVDGVDQGEGHRYVGLADGLFYRRFERLAETAKAAPTDDPATLLQVVVLAPIQEHANAALRQPREQRPYLFMMYSHTVLWLSAFNVQPWQRTSQECWADAGEVTMSHLGRRSRGLLTPASAQRCTRTSVHAHSACRPNTGTAHRPTLQPFQGNRTRNSRRRLA